MATFDTSVLRQPRWMLAALVAVVLVLSFARLGIWQLDRLDERRALNATIQARTAEPSRPLEGILGQYGDDVDGMLFRQTVVEGVYRTDDEFFSIGRSFGDARGTLVVTPLDLPNGTVLIVVRGLVPPETAGPPAAGYGAPRGSVTLVGRIDDGEEPTPIGESEPDGGRLTSLSRLDLAYIGEWIDGEILPLTLILEEQQPGDPEGVPIRMPAPELTEGSHLGYAVQWFAFAIIVGVGVASLVYRAGKDEGSDRIDEDQASLA